jgi:hypothetical protein
MENTKTCNCNCTHENTTTLEDGVYMELFAVKDGVRYNAKVVSMGEASMVLTNGLMDGVAKLWEA